MKDIELWMGRPTRERERVYCCFYVESGHKLFKGLKGKRHSALSHSLLFRTRHCVPSSNRFCSARLLSLCFAVHVTTEVHVPTFNTLHFFQFSTLFSVPESTYQVPDKKTTSSPNWNNTADGIGIEMIILCVYDWKIAINSVLCTLLVVAQFRKLESFLHIISIHKRRNSTKQHAIKSFTTVHILRSVVLWQQLPKQLLSMFMHLHSTWILPGE